MKKYYHLFRIKHYFKNFIIFTPLLFIEKKIIFHDISELLIVFVIFCLSASLIYIYNDIVDQVSDKKHPEKRKVKPLANGQISINHAYKLIVLIFLLISTFLYFKQKLIIIILTYIFINYLYTNFFKKIILFDIVILSSNYPIRVLAGCIGLSIPLSYWMGATIFSGALFLSALKRKQELLLYGSKSRKVLKFYSIKSLQVLTNISSFFSIIFYSSYVISVNNKLIITIPLVIYGIVRYNYLSLNKKFTDSPIDEIINDRQNLILIFLWILFVIIARLYL